MESTLQILEAEAGLDPREALVVGVSGGPDSLCLLHVLVELGYGPVAAHLDHGLRADSAVEADYVRQLSDEWGIACRVERGSVKQEAERPGVSLEEAARIARYRFLLRVANEIGASVIATGHTLDDQAETILMHFLRGSGPDGLRGILPAQDLGSWVGFPGAQGVRLVRPLLRVRREQTLAYCAEHGIKPIHDPSNHDLTYYRNRLRHELMPFLQQYNPAAAETLARTGEIMRALSGHLHAEVERHWPEAVREAGEMALAIHRPLFMSLDIAIQRQLLRQLVARLLPGMVDLGYAHVESARQFIVEEQPGLSTLAGGLVIEHVANEAVVRKESARATFSNVPQLAETAELELDGSTPLGSGWSIESEGVDLDGVSLANLFQKDKLAAGGGQEYFDAEISGGQLFVRQPRPGDRFQPLGMAGSMKLADFFINEGIPRALRAAWPLLVSGETVLWVIGLRRSEAGKLKESSRFAWRLQLRTPP